VKIGQKNKSNGDIVAKTIFAGKEIIKFSLPKSRSKSAFSNAKFSGFSKNFFVRDRPSDTGNGNGEKKQPKKL